MNSLNSSLKSIGVLYWYCAMHVPSSASGEGFVAQQVRANRASHNDNTNVPFMKKVSPETEGRPTYITEQEPVPHK